MSRPVIIRHLGCVPYEPTWHAMQSFTENRDAETVDEIWLLEHPKVFTQGQAGKAEHVLAAGDIPVVQVDRGGQVTYHGPGQLVAYVLVDVRRAGQGVRDLVSSIENSLVELLYQYDIDAYAKPDAPGVYVAEKKIASLGLRIRRGCSFHGLALNVDMDLQPFQRINPCGYAGMQMTQLRDETQQKIELSEVSVCLRDALVSHLKFSEFITLTDGIECYE
ncbi:lipoyl(octanoyl) transferase LipB [Denitrificimonas sp. JX-1]|uniref:Octanoyltransferase n=1 Tax=Denitrificimonas halotolerans TaxID=3098930 RepID=A0ABU5GSL1_9GAMM|nr:lipoyl(octanoyl) transferase LipB [Denitrificimonas sp. JX-1]MDY7219967.1 lipoyl(octanoyl) transferase LipB [Denitrificimonas sp. JX-1]